LNIFYIGVLQSRIAVVLTYKIMLVTMKKLILLTLSGYLMLAGCNRPNLAPCKVNSDGAIVFKPGNLEAVIEDNPALEVEKVKLESTQKQHLIGSIGKTIYRNNKFYILDHIVAKALYVFNRNGSFDIKIRKRGRGPGEYSECWDFDVDEQGNIYIMDINQGKIIQYDATGKFIKEHAFGFWTYQFCRVTTDTFSFYQMRRWNSVKELAFDLLYWTTNQQMPEYYFPYQYRKENPIMSKLFYYQRSGNNVLFSRNYNDTVYSIEPGGTKVKYIFDFGREAPSQEIINIEPQKDRLIKLFNGNYAWNVMNYFENDSMFSCFFYYKKRFCMMQYSKTTKNARYFRFNDMEAGGLEYTYLISNSLCDNKYVGYLVSSQYKKLKDKFVVKQLNINEKDTSVIGNNKYVNPILFLYKVKQIALK
jgi:hypothetical protein